MRNLAQCELITVAAGVSPASDHKQLQPQAGLKEDLFVEGLKILLNLAITGFYDWWNKKSPNQDKEKDKENKNARYGHSAMAPF